MRDTVQLVEELERAWESWRVILGDEAVHRLVQPSYVV